MYAYKLDNKNLDQAFLKGEPVLCRAVLSPKEKIEGGETIVVMLSNGSKYKGKVMRFNHVFIKGFAMGELEIVKFS